MNKINASIPRFLLINELYSLEAEAEVKIKI